MSSPLLEVRHLSVHFPLRSGLLQRQTGVVKALDNVSLTVEKGSTLGLVGESGSGKTTLGRVIVRLVNPTSGSVHYAGQELTSLHGSELRPFRKKIQMVFQDPYNSLNPRLRIGTILAEPLEIHFPSISTADRTERVAELLQLVGLDPAGSPMSSAGVNANASGLLGLSQSNPNSSSATNRSAPSMSPSKPRS